MMKDRLPSLMRRFPPTEGDEESTSELIEEPCIEDELNEETNNFLELVLFQRHDVVRLRKAAASVGLLHKILLAALDSGAPDADAVDEAIKRLDEQFTEVDKISGSVCQAISDLKDCVGSNCDSATDCRIRKDQLMALTETVRRELLKFNRNYLDYEEASRERAMDYLNTRKERLLEFCRTEIEDDRPSSEHQKTLQRSMSAYEAVLNEVKDRHLTIEKVEQSIEQLGDLFYQLQVFVETGNEMTNHIETSIERAGEFVEKTHDHVVIAVEREETFQKGRHYMRKTTRGLLISLVLLLFFLIIVLLWMFTRRFSISIH